MALLDELGQKIQVPTSVLALEREAYGFTGHLLSNNSLGEFLQREIQGAERGVSAERLHWQRAAFEDVVLANLNHRASSRNNAPAFLQKLSGEGVENNINTIAVGCV